VSEAGDNSICADGGGDKLTGLLLFTLVLFTLGRSPIAKCGENRWGALMNEREREGGKEWARVNGLTSTSLNATVPLTAH